jgi:hypothetical protein
VDLELNDHFPPRADLEDAGNCAVDALVGDFATPRRVAAKRTTGGGRRGWGAT